MIHILNFCRPLKTLITILIILAMITLVTYFLFQAYVVTVPASAFGLPLMYFSYYCVAIFLARKKRKK